MAVAQNSHLQSALRDIGFSRGSLPQFLGSSASRVFGNKEKAEVGFPPRFYADDLEAMHTHMHMAQLPSVRTGSAQSWRTPPPSAGGIKQPGRRPQRQMNVLQHSPLNNKASCKASGAVFAVRSALRSGSSPGSRVQWAGERLFG